MAALLVFILLIGALSKTHAQDTQRKSSDRLLSINTAVLEKVSYIAESLRDNRKGSSNCNEAVISPSRPSISVFPETCEDIEEVRSGEATVYSGNQPIRVYCDRENQNGGWTVFLRRVDDNFHFEMSSWDRYKEGFGDLSGSFWLGLENLYLLTRQKHMKLRVELEDQESNVRYAEYSVFFVGPSWIDYRLFVGGYYGDLGDALYFNNGMSFSTWDRDNDDSSANCANARKGGWWYAGCGFAGLLGEYFNASDTLLPYRGLFWRQWHGDNYPYKRAEMKMKPIN